MFYHILLTTDCDLKCGYCYDKSIKEIETDFGDFEVDYSVPKTISYSIDALKNFIEKDPDAHIIFYGGEPLLCMNEMEKIMDSVNVGSFTVQTNGIHLAELDIEYLKRISTIFVSIDGNEKLTDHNRGRGVYRKIIDNLSKIRHNGFKGEIVARMTVTEETDIYRQVMWLLRNPDFPFSSIHWQIDAGFWKSDLPARRDKFKVWSQNVYNPGISRLIKFWVENMRRYGQVLRIYPFLDIMESLLKGERSSLRCGSGWINYSIQTDGHIIPCPIMNGMRDFYLGHINRTHPLRLRKLFVGHPCTECDILGDCGGRCLYANLTKRWPDETYTMVCQTVRNMIDSLRAAMPIVQSMISTGRISIDQFNHIKYNGCEVIP
ncbi:MAG: TIGR04084 family radical SAM/SPASM domain-containing protein [Nitrososphaerota archaeon]|nr:TIGR04084 family radical SAM/SPASM domain-containing protein [Candidatus Bathyarchaeota archaeon]MDW8049026.1 TIGR04084 family radical SAM/SPASM domain-containing protein [Nitrososphaerota archaeon]